MKYILCHEGKTFGANSYDELQKCLIDEFHYSYMYAKELANKAFCDKVKPFSLDYIGGKRLPWLLNGVRLNEKTVFFDLTFHGMTDEIARATIHFAKRAYEVRKQIEEVHELSQKMDEEFKEWLNACKTNFNRQTAVAVPNLPPSV